MKLHRVSQAAVAECDGKYALDAIMSGICLFRTAILLSNENTERRAIQCYFAVTWDDEQRDTEGIFRSPSRRFMPDHF